MYPKEEAGRIRTEFWTTFGQYMSPVPSAEGEKINWINYRTGEKHIHFKTDVQNKAVTIAIILDHPDAGVRHLHFEQLLSLRTQLHTHLQEEWLWQQDHSTDSRSISRVCITLGGQSIYNREHWPAIISFIKQRMIALDAFWTEAKYFFELLR